MDRKKLVKRLIYLIFFILVVNIIAHKFYWYSAIWYFDIIMHFIGGFWLGLAYIWFFGSKEILKLSFQLIFKILLFVLLVAIGWEVFQFFANNLLAQKPFDIADTVFDILFGVVGGGASIFYVFKRIMLVEKSTA